MPHVCAIWEPHSGSTCNNDVTVVTIQYSVQQSVIVHLTQLNLSNYCILSLAWNSYQAAEWHCSQIMIENIIENYIRSATIQLMTNMIRVQLWSYFFNCMCSWLQHLLPNMHSSFRRATYVGLRTFVSYKHCLHDNWIKLNVLPIVLVIRIISVYQLHWSCSYLLHVHISRWLCQR